ncbi:hypothetical protein GCM10009647_012790 [Streptomyces sanglieri]
MAGSQDRERVRELLDSVRAAGREALTAPEGRIVAQAYGIAVPGEELAQDIDEAVACADRLGGPVVLKSVSPDVPHKTDAGGCSGLRDPRQVRGIGAGGGGAQGRPERGPHSLRLHGDR